MVCLFQMGVGFMFRNMNPPKNYTHDKISTAKQKHRGIATNYLSLFIKVLYKATNELADVLAPEIF